MRYGFLTLLMMTSLAGNVWAAQFNALQVTNNGRRYQVSADVYLAAPLPQVYQVLTDYDQLARIGGLIQQSHLLKQIDAHTYIVSVESRGCVLFFCHTIRQVQHVVELTPQDVVAEALPEQSDVTMATSSWHLEPQGSGTHMHWEASLEPKFWIPPLIGPLLVKSELRSQGEAMAAGLEKLARERAHLPPLNDEPRHAA